MDAEKAKSGSKFLITPNNQSPNVRKSSQHGFVLIWAAVGMFFFLGLVALVIDAGYLYFTKKQLSVAADSGALAGATQIFKKDDCVEAIPASPPANGECPAPDPNCNARLQARTFAGFHKAGGASGQTSVTLNLNNTSNDPNGDIILGNYTRNRGPGQDDFIPCKPDASNPSTGEGRPVNAVRVRARRDSRLALASGVDPSNAVSVPTFFAPVLNSAFSATDIDTYATAQKTSRSSMPIAVPKCAVPSDACVEPSCPSSDCNGTSNFLTFSPTTTENACWTTFFDNSSSASVIEDYVKAPLTVECVPSLPSTPITLSQGVKGSAFSELVTQCGIRGGANCTADTKTCTCTTPWYIRIAVVDLDSCTPVTCSHPASVIGFATMGITLVTTENKDATKCGGNSKCIGAIFPTDCSVDVEPTLSQCSKLVE